MDGLDRHDSDHHQTRGGCVAVPQETRDDDSTSVVTTPMALCNGCFSSSHGRGHEVEHHSKSHDVKCFELNFSNPRMLC
jgi:hypothetical protein